MLIVYPPFYYDDPVSTCIKVACYKPFDFHSFCNQISNFCTVFLSFTSAIYFTSTLVVKL